MKKTFKLTVLLLTMLTALTICVFFANADSTADVKASGTKNGITWVLTTDGVLNVSGTDSIPNSSSTPWYSYRKSITSVIIEEGVTGIGNSSFYAYSSLKSVIIPDRATLPSLHPQNNCCTL